MSNPNDGNAILGAGDHPPPPQQPANVVQQDNQGRDFQVGAFQLKLPPFWENSPESWFIVAEAQFRACSITTEHRRYTHLLASLTPDIIQQVSDLVQNPPDEARLYTVFKEKLLHRLTPNEEQRIASLLYHTEMGDRKPSEFYRHMEQLVGQSNEIGRNTIRKLFINRLPKSIERSLILLENQPISDQIEIADKLWEVENSRTPKFASVNSASAPKPSINDATGTDSSDFSKLNKEISELKLAIKNLSVMNLEENNFNNDPNTIKRSSRRFSRGNRFLSRSRSRSRGQNRSSSTPENHLCWYHEKFRDKAVKCCKPCKFFASSSGNDEKDAKN